MNEYKQEYYKVWKGVRGSNNGNFTDCQMFCR